MSEPRWLDDEQQEAWRTYLYAAVLLQESLDRQLQRDAGMPHSYYAILGLLGEVPERSLTMGQIAEYTRSSPSKLSHAVARLEDRGWVRRCRHPDNARQVVATLTDAGYDALVAAAPGHVEQVRTALFDHLDRDQVHHLRDIFRTVLAHLEDVPEGCHPMLAPQQPSASDAA
ncbi:MAG TPA: MarR family transcriptional regulator [Euzebyales bacterium]|nr:MarR family transcriptional regulator [Euzebyales bacterium]